MNNTVFNFKSMIIGHRGIKGSVMENTLESIVHAIDCGVDGVEFDVQRCLTGEVVLFHDETLDRLAFKDEFYFHKTREKSIDQLQWYHLSNTDLIDSMGRKYKIPLLSQVLRYPKVYNSDILINIEIKDKQSQEDVSMLIMDLVDEGLYDPGRFIVTSYNIEPLIYLNEFKSEMISENKNYQNFKIGLIFAEEYMGKKSVLHELKTYSKVLTHAILETILVNSDVIDQIGRMGLRTFVYTINSKDDFPIPGLENVVDGIITDRPKNFL